MSDIDIFELFPQMQPIKGPPRLFNVNGCGTACYGARDRDPQTGTYIKTYCLTILFVPVLALRAYRVLDANPGWYFLGRERLSGMARFWNRLVVACLLGLVVLSGWRSHTTSEHYMAGKRLAKARQLADGGRLVQAARLDLIVMENVPTREEQASAALQALLNGPLRQAKADEVAAVFATVLEFQQRAYGRTIVPDLRERAQAEIERFAESDPAGALAVLDVIARMDDNENVLVDLREQLLVRAVAAEPQNPELASRLALIYESRDEFEKCFTLLAPHQERLGAGEGARILGQMYAQRGEVEASFSLLAPYSEARLRQLHQAEQAYNDAVEQASERIVSRLDEGNGPDWFYRQYQQAASDSEKQALVRDYVVGCIRVDETILAKQQALMGQAAIVPVALDLGIVRLRRAQAMTNEQARQQELEAAEKTFLSIRGLAGESDSYRLFLGQVYYWLGKHAEGRKLLDELLASQQRSYEVLLAVSKTLREVGAASESRELSEEAYHSETDQAKKHQAAALRALTYLDLDDEIEWLGRSDPADSNVKASLSAARGNKALGKGHYDEAARHFREALEAFEAQIQNAFTINDTALVYASLFRITGDPQHYQKSLELLDRAVALQPSDSVLLLNSAYSILTGALQDIIGESIDLKALRRTGSFELFPYLYEDAAGREPFRERVRSHLGVARALAYFDRALVLSPKNASAYAQVASVHGYLRDVAALRELHARMQHTDFSGADIRQRIADFYSGKHDAKYLESIQASLETLRGLVDQHRGRQCDRTFAVAIGSLVETQMTADLFGLQSDPDSLVTLAREAHAASPSGATRNVLAAALLFRGSRSLNREVPSYAAMRSRAGRFLSHMDLVALLLSQPGEPAHTALQNNDVKEAISLVVEDAQAFPDDPSPRDWAILRLAHPDRAVRVAGVVQQNEVIKVRRDIERLLSPLNTNEAVNSYLLALMAGDEPGAREIFKTYAAQGVPIPLDME